MKVAKITIHMSRELGAFFRIARYIEKISSMSESMRRELDEHEAKLKEFELKRKMRTTVIPTDDLKVRQMLRQLGEPITIFGEKEGDRRDRLRKIAAQQDAEFADAPAVGQIVLQEQVAVINELFYTEGSEELKQARTDIALFSLRRAAERIQGVKKRRADPELASEYSSETRSILEEVGSLAQQSSEMGDDRPVSGCQFSPDGQLLAICGWGGNVTLWNAVGCSKRLSARAHEERCTDVSWHPMANISQSPEAVNLATGCANSTAALLSASGQVLQRLTGHTDRLARTAFHPMGRHLATASYDMTWRLWDVEVGSCLLEQEGHSRAVYTVGFHPDGSLAASAGLDAIGRVWDCRTGRSVLTLEGHVKQILALDFSPNGYHVVTGSDDHTCKVWDLRSKKCLYTIAGHRSLVSSVKFERSAGVYIVSGAFDCLVKVWSGSTFACLKTLAGHEGKVMCVDIAPDGSNMLASVSYDRTIKMWAPEDVPQSL
ncbi:hypothetical protein CEUSTIGMA_g6892.t1 [Chlamydomonas eustigma]|uniref:Pre-mRNA processing factor 4 (PRP4)-like domain-containing protein n=1 Tax=Chlamydomonas eustigma TaxID=1157962 RepID=A0A250X8P1_9CHLO|nr:hypothetical protein CEUSTIGMA_g6892.t1 [Chlamydomonas eustigma]|eukprot:GAX79451.1 hypothetical protein CEUSTIGMA_g6892.t1 [Chlamydomonas eustigma]